MGFLGHFFASRSRFIFVLAFLLLVSACTTTDPEVSFGLMPGYEGFVPARIAVFPCRLWPSESRFAGQPLTNAKDTETALLCQSLDNHVLESFSNQPFMNGFTPKYLSRLLAESQKQTLLDQVFNSWSTQGATCKSCRSVVDVYKMQIASRPEWQAWLADLSLHAKRVDAVLLPFITFAYTQTANDRGLLVVERAASISLLLISTAKGELIWAGTRLGDVANKRLESSGVHQDLQPPEWSDLQASLFIQDLWRDFPGRQIY